MRTRVLPFVGTLLVLFALAPVAHACSCHLGDPRDRLERSDGAFIGRLVSRDPAPPNAHSTTYHFRVDEAIKGDIGETVDVESSTNGASCGFEVSPGEQMGFLIDRDGDGWRGGLCGQIEPDDLRRAAAPLPKPNGSGPLAFLVGGTYGDVRTVGLDDAGRTLRYGEGTGSTRRLSVCPGADAAAEVVWADTEPHGTYLAVRDLRTFTARSKVRISGFNPSGSSYPVLASAVSCRSSSGDDVVVFGASNDAGMEDATGKIVRIHPDGQTVLWEGGSGGEAAFTPSGAMAYVATKTGKLVEVDLENRASRDIAKIDGVVESGVALSPDGRRVAILTGNGLSLVDVRTGEVRETNDGHGEQVLWSSDDRLIVTGVTDTDHTGEPEVVAFDGSLARTGAWRGWPARRTIVDDGTLYGMAWGRLVRAPALSGPTKDVRTFDSPELTEIAAVPHAQSEPEPTHAPRSTSSPAATPGTTAEPTTSPEPTPSAVALPQEPADDRASRVPMGAAAVGSVMVASGLALAYTRRMGA